MYVQDLGQLDGPVLLFGGPYSNLPATQALIAQAYDRGIALNHIICTGDIVAYCGDPVETVAGIRDLGCAVVAGNCEKQLANGQADCGCGFETGSVCDLLSAGWYAQADRAIGAEDRAWMGRLPDIVTYVHQGRHCVVIHGGVRDISRFIWSSSPDKVFAEEIDMLRDIVGPVDLIISGHSGLPFQRRIGDVAWLNSGVIGMPPNDGAPLTRYAVQEEGCVRLHHLSYDYETAAKTMRANGLTQGYHTALQTGYWPSEDVLPPDLRRPVLASG